MCDRLCRWTLGGMLAFFVCLFSPAASSVQGADPGTAISAHLAAGEFGPALQIARGLDDTGQRDQWLGRIATAQATVGARQASLSTLLDVRSDVARNAITEEMGGVMGARGGAAMADFDTLINLITSTIAPDSWDDVGGAGAVEPFPTGVYVDASGVMKRLAPSRARPLLGTQRHAATARFGQSRCAPQFGAPQSLAGTTGTAVAAAAGLWPISQRLHAAIGRDLPHQVSVRLPETGDMVLAGPASDWHKDAEGRVVNGETGTPVLQLDDLVTVLRNAYERGGKLGCAIKPRQENSGARPRHMWTPGRASRCDGGNVIVG